MRLALQHRAAAPAAAAAAAAAAAGAPGAQAPPRLQPVPALPQRQQRRQQRRGSAVAAAAPEAPPRPAAAEGGHTALLHGLGQVGDVSAVHMPWLLRLAHIKSKITGGDSNAALQDSARGLLLWKVRFAAIGRPRPRPPTQRIAAAAAAAATGPGAARPAWQACG